MNLTRAHVLQARAELARRHLADYCGLIEIPGAPLDAEDDEDRYRIRPIPAAHHRLLIEKLEAVERGDIRRLMVFMPPGSAKSSYASIVFPTWFMGRAKRRNVIVATYASDLARKIGRRARSILRQPIYEQVFGVQLSADTAAADEWALTNENEFMGGGILSGITGNRADLIIIDDPIKGRQQADSEQIRSTTRAAYDDDLKTRLKPGGRIVLIQTRWHEDDLAGSLLPEAYDGECGPVTCRDGEVWEVLSIPAEARANDPLGRRPGEMLWPEWFDDKHWAAFRSNPRTWAALYQQSPRPDDGSYFQRSWFKRWRVKPANLHVYMTSDHATKEDAGDFTVFRVWGVDPLGDLYLLDGFKEQTTTDKWMARGVELIRRHKPLCWFPENDQAWRAVAPFIQRYMYAKNVNCRREPLPTSGGDKPTKARGFQAMASMGRVHLPETPEGDEILNEYLRFPAGKHDDEVDAAANIGRALDEAHPAIVRVQSKPSGPRDTYTRARPSSGDENDWMVA